MQLVLVELCEFSKDLSLLFFGQARSAVLHLHAEDTHGIRSELVGQRRVRLDIRTIRLDYRSNSMKLKSHLIASVVVSARAEQLARDANADFAFTRSELHLQRGKKDENSLAFLSGQLLVSFLTALVMRLRMTCSIL